MESEIDRIAAYRASRRNFIAAAEAAGGDAISRVHPARGPDGKPLFCDSVALGPRDAGKALLLIGGKGDAIATLLKQRIQLPKDMRLVAVHALDPFADAWGKSGEPADWPAKALSSIATENLSRVQNLVVLDFAQGWPETALAAAFPKVAVTRRAVKPEHAELALIAAIAAL
jgi:hypothetical protein